MSYEVSLLRIVYYVRSSKPKPSDYELSEIRQELLGLGERIGQVGTGLLEEIITRDIWTKTYLLHDNLEGLRKLIFAQYARYDI